MFWGFKTYNNESYQKSFHYLIIVIITVFVLYCAVCFSVDTTKIQLLDSNLKSDFTRIWLCTTVQVRFKSSVWILELSSTIRQLISIKQKIKFLILKTHTNIYTHTRMRTLTHFYF